MSTAPTRLSQSEVEILRRRYRDEPAALAWLDAQSTEQTPPVRPQSTPAAKTTKRTIIAADRS